MCKHVTCTNSMQHLLSRKHAVATLLQLVFYCTPLIPNLPIPLRSGPKFAVDLGIVVQCQTYCLEQTKQAQHSPFQKVSKGFERVRKVSKGFERFRKVSKGFERFRNGDLVAILAIPLGSFSMKDVTVILLPYFFRAYSSFDQEFDETSTKRLLD